jgi:hypothetical protein
MQNTFFRKFFVIHVPFLKVGGMALFPFVLVRAKKPSKALLNHEYIHLRQQLELLIIPFYILYILAYSINFLKYKNHYRAYMNIYFEKEAYQNDDDFNYLKNRKLWSFINYI